MIEIIILILVAASLIFNLAILLKLQNKCAADLPLPASRLAGREVPPPKQKEEK